MLDTESTFKSYFNQSYEINKSMNCKTQTIIYLISCAWCTFKYVGRSKIMVNIRAKEHRESLRCKKSFPRLIEHFTRMHRPADLHIKPIEHLLNTSLDYAKERELYWIKELCTLSPYGLNDRLDNPYVDAKSYYLKGNCIYSLFNKQHSKRRKRGKGTKCKPIPTIRYNTRQALKSENAYLDMIKAYRNYADYRNIVRIAINKMKKGHICRLISSYTMKSNDKSLRMFHMMVIDLCRNYWKKTLSNTPKEDALVQYLYVILKTRTWKILV